MFNKIRTLASLYRELGFRWSVFRVAYAFRRRAGLLRLQMPRFAWTDRPLETWLKADVPSEPDAYARWRKQNSPKFFFEFRAERSAGRVERAVFSLVSKPGGDEAQIWNQQPAMDEADRLLSGELKYFSHTFHKTGFPPNWHKDPVTGIELPAHKHWSEIPDDAGVDIKFIWEASRFSFVYTLVRAYAASRDERYAEAFWESILDWAEHNPPNAGSNWMDGQEIALRIMAWCFGLYAFADSPASTPPRLAQLTAFIAAQAQRIYRNTDFALFTRGNHIISEALGLWLVGLLFPELKDAGKYLSTGRRLLEQEAAAQIFPDGSYSMYSLNYHRFILHVYLYAMRLGEIHNAPFSDSLRRAVTNSVEYLTQLIDPQNGQMSVYGSNDGALVLPLNNCDFNDYRPLLQLGWYLTNGERLFESGEWDEDLFWLYGEQSLAPNPSPIGRGGLWPPSP
ncbi:MAG: heparinase II/III family protein, partial [Chloroflexota bacterium]